MLLGSGDTILNSDAGPWGFGVPGIPYSGSGDTILDSDACPWVRVSGVSRSGPAFCSRDAQEGLVTQRAAGMLVAAEDFQFLFPNHADQRAAPVGGLLEQRSNPHQRIVRPRRYAVALLQRYRIGALTESARTGLSSTSSRRSTDRIHRAANEAKRTCQRCLRSARAEVDQPHRLNQEQIHRHWR